ncbi:MAG TPA: hypothetical protein VGF45_15715 [Polyangia bacterium]
MVTDPVPRAAGLRRQFELSDARTELPLPPAAPLQAMTKALGEALALDDRKAVKSAGAALLSLLSEFYGTKVPALKVLGARPLTVVEGTLSYELFGDYTPSTQVIRVWMRTAVLGKVTSHRGLLNTLLHEFCHHLDVCSLALPDTPHTRGFFARVDELYHLALATPPAQRRPLVWVRRGGLWHIDWRRLRAPRTASGG